jgi:hypothetical protein
MERGGRNRKFEGFASYKPPSFIFRSVSAARVRPFAILGVRRSYPLSDGSEIGSAYQAHWGPMSVCYRAAHEGGLCGRGRNSWRHERPDGSGTVPPPTVA